MRFYNRTCISKCAPFLALLLWVAAAVAPGCLDRPVAPATPTVSARIVTLARQDKVSKIDLLFMIDNSSSMADKQSILALAVPDLVNRLVNPVCVDPATGLTTGNRRPDGSCATGEPDFDPVKDIHIGIITSSLGAHGATACNDDTDKLSGRSFPHNNDNAHLVARDLMDTAVPTFNNEGFLNWNPVQMPGQMDVDIETPFTTMVHGVGQHGCGYEAQLESIYRFLIDPEPYESYSVDTTKNPPLGVVKLNGVDSVLLQQRADFLRPDSLVAVIMLTDENDNSEADFDGAQSFYPLLQPPVLSRGTSPCSTNINDPCCFNCGESSASHPTCPDPAGDPQCKKGAYTAAEDPPNLRNNLQKSKYGVDFFWPIQRYINGLTSDMVTNRAGQAVKNPLFDDLSASCNKTTRGGCAAERDPSLVFFVGITGVPWQDIAVDPHDLTHGYLTAQQMSDMNIWDKIVGDATPPNNAPPIPPTDPHMIESIAPRAGLPGPNSPASADPINGHEWDPSMLPNGSANDDLQYACIFPLSPPKICMAAQDCDCAGPVAMTRSPLCQDLNTNAYSSTQGRAKAYPGLRQLEVLRGIGPQAIVASICPANVTNMAAADFGYRPAISALISRLRVALRGRCLPRQLAVTPDGRVPCVIVEAFNPPAGATCNCQDKPGRVKADPQTITPEVQAQGSCFCEIVQLDGANQNICETQLSPPSGTVSGWCYVDPSQTKNVAECPIVANCPSTDRRIIRFVNPDSEPRSGATAFIMCQESSFPAGGAPMDPCPQ
jgi:hypothetical protein